MIAFIATIAVAVFTYIAKEKQYVNLKQLSKAKLKKQYHSNLFYQEKNHAEIISKNAFSYFLDKNHEAEQEFNKEFFQYKIFSAKTNLLCNFFVGILFLTNILYLYYIFQHHTITFSLLITVMLVTLFLYFEIQSFLDKLTMDKEALYYVDKFFQFINYPEEASIKKDMEITSISLNDISFSYGNHDILKHINLSINSPDKLLLIGENGAGKTTLLNILSGLYHTNAGNIAINGTVESDLCWIRDYVAIVSQNFPILNLSIRENFFCDSATEEEMLDTLKKVGLLNAIKQMPHGLDTIIGDLGDEISLSKGQWQRFAIARMLLKKKAAIWILDEPTSSLDAIAEQNIFELLLQEGKNKIIIFVTHRLGFASKTNRIICMKNGEIDYIGTHAELLQTNEAYQKLYQSQAMLYQ